MCLVNLGEWEDYIKRPGEISQIKLFNPNLRKNKSYYMNFKHKNMNYMSL